MGEAKRRGTFEERKAQAIQREQQRLEAIEAARENRRQQEIQAYRTMTWWQIDMSEERHNTIMQRRRRAQALLAGWAGMVAPRSGFGAIQQ